MIRYVASLLVATMCAFSTTHLDGQEIIENSTIANVIPLIDEETWVLVDLDNTEALQLLSQEIENQENQMIQNPTPEYLYKIISAEEWQKSLLQNEVVGSSIDKEFVHLAKEDQLAHVAQKFWNNMDYIVLKLASKKLVGRLIYETNPGGSTQYYHLYEGNIPLDAVVDVTVVRTPNK